MTPNWLTLAVALHLLGIIVWLGGMIFIAVVFPRIRHLPGFLTFAERTGRAFQLVSYLAFALILVGGLWAGYLRGYFHGAQPGAVLFWHKFAIFLLILLLALLHDLWLGPKAAKSQPVIAHSYRRAARWVSRLALLLGLVNFVLGILLSRG